MYELIYRSTAISTLSDNDISDILEVSQKNNLENDITGCLLFYQNIFIQILEGDEHKVKELFEKIKIDKRHTNVILIAEAQKKEPIFPNWSMAYHKLNNKDSVLANEFLFVNNLIVTSKLASKPTRVSRLFWKMVLQLLENKKIN